MATPRAKRRRQEAYRATACQRHRRVGRREACCRFVPTRHPRVAPSRTETHSADMLTCGGGGACHGSKDDEEESGLSPKRIADLVRNETDHEVSAPSTPPSTMTRRPAEAPSARIADEIAARLPLSFREFIGLMALLMSMSAMSIDILLPALPEIGATLGVRDASNLPLVVTVFMLGMAIGQLVWGPLADRFGRRRPLLLGLC